MIKAIFWDLDFCIVNTTPLYDDPNFLDPVFDVLTDSGLPHNMRKCAEKNLKGNPLQSLKQSCDVPDYVLAKMFTAYGNLVVPDYVKSYGDEECIPKCSDCNILVTTGLANVQQQKIEKIRIAHYFQEIVIDVVDDLDAIKGKEAIFIELLEKHQVAPSEVVVVGDKVKSELGIGKKLGMPTIQTVREGIQPWEEADFRVKSICEIPTIVERLNAL